MPLSAHGSLSLGTAGESSKSAYLVKFPEEIWAQLQSTLISGQGISIAVNDGMELQLPTTSIPLTLQPLGAQTELYTLPTTSTTLNPLATSTHRLTLPMSLASSKPRSQIQTQTQTPTQTPAPAKNIVPIPVPIPSKADTPMIPLKTRVIQLLALGETSLGDIVGQVGMAEEEVMRVVNVVGRQNPSGNYALQPSKYTQVKIQPWKYTHSQKLEVIRLARVAFDELDLPPDADERVELERKEAEVVAAGSSRSSSSSEGDKTPYTPVAVAVPTPPKLGKKEVVKASPVGKKERGKKVTSIIGKQKAKFVKEKRAGSMNSGHGDAASPRIAPVVVEKEVPVLEVELGQEVPKKTKLELAIEARKAKKALARREPAGAEVQHEDTSSRSSQEKESEKRTSGSDVGVGGKEKRKLNAAEDVAKPLLGEPVERGRARDIKPVQFHPPKRARDYSSSPSTSPERKLANRSPTKRKPPPPSLNLLPKSRDNEASVDVPPPNLTPRAAYHDIPARNDRNEGYSYKANGTKKDRDEERPDPEVMRERYEELIPAYELLTGKLKRLHEDAREGSVDLAKEEVAKLVDRWGRWHKELEGIRRWFGEE